VAPKRSFDGKQIKLYKKETNGKSKLRLLAAIHRKQGKSIDKISELLEKPRKTVHGWLTVFQERGISGKDSVKQEGRPCSLNGTQMKELVKRLEKGPSKNPSGLWTAKEVRNLIREKYGILYGRTNTWKILIAAGFTPQVPRKRHYKRASDEEIERFKKTPSGKQGSIERKVLLWPQKTRQHLA
jgi:transposase